MISGVKHYEFIQEMVPDKGNRDMKWTCAICGNRVMNVIIKNAKAVGSQYDIYYCDQCMVGKTVQT